MQCCDAEISPGNCSLIDTCDTEIIVKVVNFDRSNAPLGTNLVVGIYENSDSIIFPSCGVLEGGNNNPLVLTFSTSDFSVGVSCKIGTVV